MGSIAVKRVFSRDNDDGSTGQVESSTAASLLIVEPELLLPHNHVQTWFYGRRK
jgi:hypothetical protein